MEPTFVITGNLTREYILPPASNPLLDVPGGSALYCAGGLLPWAGNAAIVARIGEDYPRAWIKDLQARGIDTDGIQILQQSLDLRAFHAYSETFELTRGSPVSQFARRSLTFPKLLLGYQEQAEGQAEPREPDEHSPLAGSMPVEYRDARAAHICPLDFPTQNQLLTNFGAGSVTTITLDPASAYMIPSFLRDLRVIVARVTAFLPSEQDLRNLFWGQTHDLWEMAAGIGEYGCDIVVVKCGAHGQLVYDVKGQHRWEIPAYPARLADPTGAGDAFCGGFLAGFHKTYDPVQAALHGNVSASLKVEGSGAFYPTDVLPGLAEARLHALTDLVRQL